jgi:hypothetical protein
MVRELQCGIDVKRTGHVVAHDNIPPLSEKPCTFHANTVEDDASWARGATGHLMPYVAQSALKVGEDIPATDGDDDVHRAFTVITPSRMTVISTVAAVTHVGVNRTEGTWRRLATVAVESSDEPLTNPLGGF